MEVVRSQTMVDAGPLWFLAGLTGQFEFERDYA